MSDNEKRWGFLPDEILTHIFHCLLIKSIIVCTSVSKTWKSLIKNPTFISTFIAMYSVWSVLVMVRSAFLMIYSHTLTYFICGTLVLERFSDFLILMSPFPHLVGSTRTTRHLVLDLIPKLMTIKWSGLSP